MSWWALGWLAAASDPSLWNDAQWATACTWPGTPVGAAPSVTGLPDGASLRLEVFCPVDRGCDPGSAPRVPADTMTGAPDTVPPSDCKKRPGGSGGWVPLVAAPRGGHSVRLTVTFKDPRHACLAGACKEPWIKEADPSAELVALVEASDTQLELHLYEGSRAIGGAVLPPPTEVVTVSWTPSG